MNPSSFGDAQASFWMELLLVIENGLTTNRRRQWQAYSAC